MRLGEKNPKDPRPRPYEIDIEDEKEDAPSDPEPSPVRHEPRRELILRAPIRLRDDGSAIPPARRSFPRPGF